MLGNMISTSVGRVGGVVGNIRVIQRVREHVLGEYIPHLHLSEEIPIAP